ncbi:hypothetical protein H9P43_007013 [Blastocladiella emersonii ATCC 22665]|nr:hypothetical protein H9P43_007013 [Blastocladiella emersonii ATCC 22665]
MQAQLTREEEEALAELNGHGTQLTQEGSQRPLELLMTQSQAMGSQEENARRRSTRRRYRELAQNLEERRSDYLRDPGLLLDSINEMNELQQTITTTTESSMDTKLLLAATQIAQERIQSLKIGRALFDVNAFITRLTGAANARPGSTLTEIGNLFGGYLDHAPALEFMLGPMDVTVTKRERAQRAAKEVAEKQVVKSRGLEEHAQVASQSDSSQTPKFVSEVFTVLRDLEEPVPLFEFVLNPRSFAQTVENLFYVSFLVKDSIAAVMFENDDSQDAMLYVIEGAQEPNTGPGSNVQKDDEDTSQRNQWIPSLTTDEWQGLCEYYQLTEPKYIAHRDYSHIPA